MEFIGCSYIKHSKIWSGKLILLFPIALINVLIGCASYYHPISLGLMDYNQGDTINGISYGYHFNTLQDFRNNKYSAREVQNNISLVAFQIINTGETKIDLVKDLEYFQDNSGIINPMDPEEAYNSIKLSSKLCFADLAIMGFNIYFIQPSGNKEKHGKSLTIIPIGIFLGPMITLYNISKNSKSNKNFSRDLKKYSPFRSIEPGSKYYVLIPFKGIIDQPVHVRFRK